MIRHTEAQEKIQKQKGQRHVYTAMYSTPCFHETTGSRKKTESGHLSSMSFSVFIYKMRTAML